MQIDMHYYGTYCIARSAGVPKDKAHRIAQCAQYVDDSNAHEREIDDHPDGGKFATVVTAHTGLSSQNRNEDDQRLVWVPFHFLPGNEGETFSQRLICRKNSQIARIMIEHHLEYSLEYSFGPELVGIGMHAYADTFAHYGFAGISSRVNRVVADSIKLKQSEAIVENFLGKTLNEWFGKWGGLVSNFRKFSNEVAEDVTGALGHGGVSLYPDAPFLEWEYDYEYPEVSGMKTMRRNNHNDYMEAAENMWTYFNEFDDLDDDYDWNSDFNDYREEFARIYECDGNKQDRTEVWQEVARSGVLGFQEEIPEYDHEAIHQQHDDFSELESSSDGVDTLAYRFHQAATVHRDYVTKILLPDHSLIVW